MSKFHEDFLMYFKYINYKGSDQNYVDNCKNYRRLFLRSLKNAEQHELSNLLEEYQFAVHMDDGYEMYKRYFSLGGRNKKVLSLFREYLWFWGDYDFIIPELDKIIEEGKEQALDGILDVVFKNSCKN